MISSHAPRTTQHALLLLLALVGGCNALGGAIYKVAGPPTIKPKFDVLQRRSVVMVENYRQPSAAADDADRMGQILTDELKRHPSVMPPGDWTDPSKIAALRSARPGEFGRMTVANVGTSVGANQVLYVDLTTVDVAAAAGGNFYKGRANATVKWVDAVTGATLWPPDTIDGYPVSYESPIRNPADGITPDSVRVTTLQGLAGNIGRLFYPYKPDEVPAVE